MSFRLLCALCLFYQAGLGQPTHLVDSLSQQLQVKSLPLPEKFEILRSLGHWHPEILKAYEYSVRSLRLAEQIGDTLLIANAYEEIGLNQRLLGNNAKSFEATYKALEIFEYLNDQSSLAATYAQLGSNLVTDGSFDQGIDHFIRSRNIYLKMGDDHNFILSTLNLGEAFRIKGNTDSALHYLFQAYELNNHREKMVDGYSLGNLGMVYNAIDELEKAKEHLSRGIKIVKTIEDPYSTSVYLAELGSVYQKEGKMNLAEKQFLEAFNLAKPGGLKEQIRDFSELFSNFYQETQQFEKALEYQKIYQIYQDSLVNKSNIQKVEQLKANYEIDKKDTEIALLEKINSQSKIIAYCLGLGTLIFVVFSILLFRRNQQKKKDNLLLAQQKEMISTREKEKGILLKELNHRVKNNLQMISSLLNMQGTELNEQSAEEVMLDSKHRVDALSMIHQKLYQEDVHSKIVAKDFFTDLILNLTFSYGNKTACDFHIEDVGLDVELMIPLTLIVNELITNSLKHAFTGEADQRITFELAMIDATLNMKISDNGIGFDQSQIKPGFGLKLITSLSQQLKANTEFVSENGSQWLLKLSS